MKRYLAGSAFLMLISSLPADATNEHALRHEGRVAAQPVQALQATREVRTQSYSSVQTFYAYGDTLPPIGYVMFCRQNPAECRSDDVTLVSAITPVALSADRYAELERVNRFVNETIEPVTDLELYGEAEVWTYPTDNKGDCEDYVLLKRRILLQMGWPESALLITVVRDENDEGHAVLTARTDQGDYILDNKRTEISLWTRTPYTFIKRQSEMNPSRWISLLPPDQLPPSGISASNGQ